MKIRPIRNLLCESGLVIVRLQMCYSTIRMLILNVLNALRHHLVPDLLLRSKFADLYPLPYSTYMYL